MEELTKTQIRLLKHALGDETEYRNYFYTTKDTADYPELCKLVDLRLMEKNQSTDKADTFIFHVTHLGKINVRAAWDWGEEDE